MLGFISGRAGTGKTYAVLKKAVDEAANHTMTYIIVPEQSTLSYEKQLIKYNAESYRLGVEVLSFTRIVEKVMLAKGGLAGNYIDPIAKKALVYRAIKDCADSLKLFGRYAESPQFAVQFAETIDELKVNNISSDSLLKVAKEDGISNTLSNKLYDTSLIVKEYERLIGGSFFDPVDKLTALCEVLDSDSFFDGCAVYFDGFNGFTPNEEEIVKRIITQSNKCIISVSAPLTKECGELFYPIVSFVKRFSDYAKSSGIEIIETLELEQNRKFTSDTMIDLENALCTGARGLNRGENVTLYSAADSYDEMRFVAAEISRLVKSNNCRYKDIAVIAADLDTCRSAVETEFERYSLPYFIDSRSDVRFRPLMRLVIFAFRAILKDMFFEDMIDVAKTGFAGVDREEAAILENYVKLWRISGKKWGKEFTLNPRGFVDSKTPEDESLLEKINEARRKLFEPLALLKKNISEADKADDFAVALYQYLVKTGAPEKIRAEKTEALKLGEEYDGERIWELLMDVFDRISYAMGNEKMSVENYSELIKLLFESADVGVIPPHIDEVIIGSVGRVRVEDIKYCFVVGATEGVFPNVSGRKGVFTNADKEELFNRSIGLIRDGETRRCEMLLSVYNVLTVPSKGVYLSCAAVESDTEFVAPSPVFKQLEEIFTNCNKKTASDLDYEFLCQTPEATLAVGAEFFNAPETVEQASVAKVIQNEPALLQTLEGYRVATLNGGKPLDADAAKYLSGKARKLSATKSDEYYKCAFRFFCRYGLSLKKEPEFQFDALTVGTFIHFMLENTVKAIYLQGFEGDMRTLASELSKRYIAEILGGEDNLPASFLNSVSRTTELVVELIKNIKAELELTGYVPVDFEVEIEDKGKVQPWRVAVANNENVSFIGKVDRVDICSKEGKDYLRIVDYKSGKKKKVLSLGNVYDGIDIQMLVYIIAIWLSKKKPYGENITPAGVYYFPANRPLIEKDDKFDKNLKEAKSMSGISLEDSPHDPASKPSFYTSRQLALVKKHIEKLFCNMHLNLAKGNIPKNPVEAKYNTCEFCPYSAICGVDPSSVKLRKVGGMSNSEVLKKLEEEYENE